MHSFPRLWRAAQWWGVRRHVRCADCRCDRAGNVTFGARETSRSVRQSCRNVTFGAPIRSRCVCHHRRHGGSARLYSHLGMVQSDLTVLRLLEAQYCQVTRSMR